MTSAWPDSLSLGDLVVDRHGVPAEDNVIDVLGPATNNVGVPERDDREVLEEDFLSLVEDGVCFFVGGSRCCLLEQAIELCGRVAGVVRASAGAVKRCKEVVLARVVSLPAGTEGAGDGAVGDLGTQGLEVRVRGANGVDSERVLDGVGDCVNPCLVATIRVVSD